MSNNKSEPWVEEDFGDPEGDPNKPGDSAVSIVWAYGPQGHPCSMRIYIVLDEFNNMSPALRVYGPNCLETHDWTNDYTFKDTVHLQELIAYGEKINQRFGKDWNWHKCRKKCNGWTRKWYYSGPCRKCEQKSKQAASDSLQWVAENPMPDTKAELTIVVRSDR